MPRLPERILTLDHSIHIQFRAQFRATFVLFPCSARAEVREITRSAPTLERLVVGHRSCRRQNIPARGHERGSPSGSTAIDLMIGLCFPADSSASGLYRQRTRSAATAPKLRCQIEFQRCFFHPEQEGKMAMFHRGTLSSGFRVRRNRFKSVRSSAADWQRMSRFFSSVC